MIKHTNRLFATLALLASLAACGSDAGASTDAGPIAGHWAQETGSDNKGMTLEFDADSDKLMVHTAPAEDGTHDHLDGTYSIDAKTGAVTVTCELAGHDGGDSWQGKLQGDELKLTAGATSLTFQRGGNPHGSK